MGNLVDECAAGLLLRRNFPKQLESSFFLHFWPSGALSVGFLQRKGAVQKIVGAKCQRPKNSAEKKTNDPQIIIIANLQNTGWNLKNFGKTGLAAETHMKYTDVRGP